MKRSLAPTTLENFSLSPSLLPFLFFHASLFPLNVGGNLSIKGEEGKVEGRRLSVGSCSTELISRHRSKEVEASGLIIK